MRYIYSCLDIGSDSIKLVVCELYHGRYNLLAASTVKSKGIKKGLITDFNDAKSCIKKCFDQVESMLGFKIKKVIAIIPSYFSEFSMIKGETLVEERVTSEDIVSVLQKGMVKLDNSKEMVTIMPVDFILDSGISYYPLGKETKSLKTRAILATAPRKNIYSVVNVLNSINVDVIDISLGAIGDINAFMDDNVKNTISAVVNIGSEKTEVSLYNKGIIVKHSVINVGSKNIDHDIAYMYKLSMETAKDLKEKYALITRNSSSLNDAKEVKNKDLELVKINQYELSEVVLSRIDEMFNLINQELNILTSHKPNIIFVTGGITNMNNFHQICREKLGNCAIIGSVNLIGLRNNKFSSAIGNIIYFVNKLKLKGKDYSMISSDEMDILSTPRKNSNDSMVGKVFSYFFGE
ncbi:MAG TPA: pilus assembly protein PilM [Candidatus Faecisoma merdavium]|nr:pilus assembly protein PilM [Candidatus Faecisoma merdavium]